MDMVLIRHGTAEPLGSPGVRFDAERALTSEGIRDMERIATGLQRILEKPGAMISSPLVRARQTAEIVAEAFGITAEELIEDERLGPDAGPQDLLEVAQKTRKDCVVLVGHDPAFSRFVSFAACSHHRGGVWMKKGGVARVQVSEGEMELLWLLPPKIMKALAE
ncbi:MAG TPA: histidine phosphatase family protein [bacterium]|nr:histidine phosphatase family protein [bacterium]